MHPAGWPYRGGIYLLATLLASLTALPAGIDLPSDPAPETRPAQAAAAAPCQSLIKSIRPGSADPDAFLAAASCLRKAEGAVVSGGGADRAAAVLKGLLPAADAWYIAHLERLRARRDIPRLQDMAWLAALKDPPGAEIWREIAESHSLAGDPFRAAYAHLEQAERDSAQSGYIQYQLDNLLRSLSDTPAPLFLDSLTDRFEHARPVTAELLESLCWSNRHLPAAYRNTLAWLALRKPGPGAALERAGRYHQSGYWDYAAEILERTGWRTYPKPWQAMGRALFLRVRFQLEDWAAIAAETAAVPKGVLTEEEDYIAAAASLRLGKAPESLDRLGRFPASGESQWGYRAQLLKSRALLSLGRLPEAAKVLDALKRDPRRREGTGPILFWQGWLALQQGRQAPAESLLVLASAYTGTDESQRALEYRYWILLDSGAARSEFFRGLAESPLSPGDRIRSLDKVPGTSPLWPYARIEKAQILAGMGRVDSARAVLDDAVRHSANPLVGLKAEAMAAYLQEKAPGGRAAALARYEDLLIKYQQGVVPEFSRGRIRALK